MTSTDIAPAEQRKPTTRIERAGLTAKVKRAIECMVWDGKRFDEAAAEVGLTSRAMRLALQKAPVLAFFKAEQQVLLASHGPRNIHRLAEIREAAANMPAVQSIKLMHELGADQQQRNASLSASPGVTIRVVTVVQSAPAQTYPSDMSRPDVKQINHLADLPSNAASAAGPRPSDAAPAVPRSAEGGGGEGK